MDDGVLGEFVSFSLKKSKLQDLYFLMETMYTTSYPSECGESCDGELSELSGRHIVIRIHSLSLSRWCSSSSPQVANMLANTEFTANCTVSLSLCTTSFATRVTVAPQKTRCQQRRQAQDAQSRGGGRGRGATKVAEKDVPLRLDFVL